jgi:thiol-disulfide isomerase/thioredoxin
MRLLLSSCLALALLGCHERSKPDANESNSESVQFEGKGLDNSHKGQAAPLLAFKAPDGSDTNLHAFLGKPTLVNLWASWCAPCVKELPTLGTLAIAERGRMNVVAISQDMAPHASVEAFLKAHQIEGVQSYQDPKMRFSGTLGAEVLPTSIFYDSSGKEVWRYVGDLDWTSPQAAKLLGEAGV